LFSLKISFPRDLTFSKVCQQKHPSRVSSIIYKKDTTDPQEDSSSPIKGKLSQMQQLIVRRVPGIDEGSLKDSQDG
jgi:hypothetical protein